MTPHLAVPGASGQWLAVVRGGNALLLRPGAIAAGELYDALGGDDPVQGTIERLTSGGFAATPDFGLVAHSSAGPLHVVVRGPVEIALDDEVLSGAEVSTWTERVVAATSGYAIRAPDVSAGEALPLADGAVWATALRSGPDAGAARPAPAASAASGSPDERHTPSSGAHPDTHEREAIAEDTVVVDQSLPEDTVLPDDEPADEPVQGGDPLDESTIVRTTDAPTVQGVPSSGPGPAPEDGDHDGMTVISSDLEGLAGRARPEAHEIARPADALSYVVVLPDGTREPLDGELIVGRSPSGRVTEGMTPRLVTLSGDPDISRTHVRIALEGDTVVVTDMHSRNGTTLQLAGKSPQLLRAGEPATVIPGTVVDLGGGTLLRIEGAG